MSRIFCRVDGSGIWSNSELVTAADPFVIEVRGIELIDYSDEDDEDSRFGEFRVHFRPDRWVVGTLGLIYTDKMWLEDFHNCLLEKFEFTRDEVMHVGYSEQGMQTKNYVSLDVSSSAMLACDPLYRLASNRGPFMYYEDGDLVWRPT